MNNPNYSSDNQNIARNANSNLDGNSPNPTNDETQTLRWDSAWQPDLDEDYGTPVQQYSGPSAFPPLPTPPPPASHPYAQAAQSVPVQSYQPTPTYANPPMQGYSTPNNPSYNTQPSPYAPVQVYVGDQPVPPTYQAGQIQDNQTYKGYVPPAQGYNGQPVAPQSPSTRPAQGWIIALFAFIILMVVLGSGGVGGFWPIWFFIFWPMWAFGGRGYGRRWRGRNRW